MENSNINESERRQATILFADISSFTTMSEKMDPEEVTSLMNECFGLLGKVIREQGGTIDKFMGDCVMAVFGVPVAVENAPKKALLAAIEMRNKIYQFNKEKNPVVPIDIHFGINSGPVLAGIVGDDHKKEFTVMGDTVNVASRLEDASVNGQILVGSTTYRYTKDNFKFRELKPVAVKGKSDLIPVYELISEKTTTDHAAYVMTRMIASKMIGRDKELNQLESLVTNLKNGQGAVVSIIGEAGIGKSRLMAEFRACELVKDVVFHEGRALSTGRNLPYHPVISILKNWAQINEKDSESESLNKLVTAVKIIHPNSAEEIIPFVAKLMGMKLSGQYAERVINIESSALDKIIFKNIRDLVIKACEIRPLIYIVEDLHWADTSTIDFLEGIYQLAVDHRILFINVMRPYYKETSEKLCNKLKDEMPEIYQAIYLQALDPVQIEQLITNLVNIQGLPSSVKNQIISRTAGNPFFIEEIIRSFIDEGAVVQDKFGFKVTDKIHSVKIPLTINDVIMARIDRLDEGTKELIKTASVIGRNFFYKILSEVAKDVIEMDERLKNLEAIQLIREQTRMDELEYLFKHALAQEAAYDSILIQKRKLLHYKVAQSIEQVFHERLHEFYGMLAFHYTKAENTGDAKEKAEEYLIKAGDAALDSSGSLEAIEYYRSVINMYREKYGDKADTLYIMQMEIKIGMAYRNKGLFIEALPYYDRYLTFIKGKLPRNHFLRVASIFFYTISSQVRLWLPIRRWYKTPNDQDREYFMMFYQWAEMLSIINQVQLFMEGLRNTSRLLKINMHKIKSGLGFFAGLSILWSWSGLSFTIARRILDIIRKEIPNADMMSKVEYHADEAMYSMLTGDVRHLNEYDNELVKSAIDAGEFFCATRYIMSMSGIMLMRGDIQQSISINQKIFEIARDYQNEFSRAVYYVMQSRTSAMINNFSNMGENVERGLEATLKSGFPTSWIACMGFKSEYLWNIGDREGSENILRLAFKRKQTMGIAPPWLLVPILIRRFKNDIVYYEEAIAIGNSIKSTAAKKTARLSGKALLSKVRHSAFNRPCAYRLDAIFIWTTGNKKRAMNRLCDSVLEARRINVRIDEARSLVEIVKRLTLSEKERHLLEAIIYKRIRLSTENCILKAETIFKNMNLELDLSELEIIKQNIEDYQKY